MTRIALALLLLAAAGCEPPASSSPSGPVARAVPAEAARPDPAATDQSTREVAREFRDLAAAEAVLLQAFADNDAGQYQAAESWLVAQGDAARDALAAVAVDESADRVHRVAACRALPRFGAGACPALQRLLSSPVEQLQVNAIRCLVQIDPLPDAAQASLLELTGPGAERIRREALLALASLGPSARERCGPRLLEILNDANEPATIRDAAKQALEKVSPRRTFADP